ncbi:hypothetical protein QA640_35895 [Bradyrhizobium sp. CB82]|uniref:hypothetical protein n=1 Tax=Bradyrhizobium sp. CB82 TaxID=3039159 RepID=UPI0024B06733|nr:hypothetical protein [Bradyrhizobium sp. CB82]WFU39687.1 hypothetical protein QA640_35895 [Bradyrhizobium sp. CB82]
MPAPPGHAKTELKKGGRLQGSGFQKMPCEPDVSGIEDLDLGFDARIRNRSMRK